MLRSRYGQLIEPSARAQLLLSTNDVVTIAPPPSEPFVKGHVALQH